MGRPNGSGFAFIRIDSIASKPVSLGRAKHYTRTFKGGFVWENEKLERGLTEEEQRIVEEDKKKAPKHIDSNRSHLNEMLVGNENTNPMKQALEIVAGREISQTEFDHIRKYSSVDPREAELYAAASKDKDSFDIRKTDGTKLKDSASLLVDVLMTYPGAVKLYHRNDDGEEIEHPEVDYQQFRKDTDGMSMKHYFDEKSGKEVSLYGVPANKEEFEHWKQVSMQFVTELYGKENVLLAALHMDETMPHIHVTCAPIVEKNGVKTFDKNEFINGPTACAKLQTEFAKAFEDVGYKRGRFQSKAVHIDPQTIERKRAELMKEFEYTGDPEKDRETYAKLCSRIAKQSVELYEYQQRDITVQEVRENHQKSYDRMQSKNEELHKMLQKLEKELEETKKQRDIKGVKEAMFKVLLFGLDAMKLQDQEFAQAAETTVDMLLDEGMKFLDKNGLTLPEIEMLKARGLMTNGRVTLRGGLFQDLDFDGHDDRTEFDDPLTTEDESKRGQDN